MLFNPNFSIERRQFTHAVFIPIIIGLLMVLSFIMEKGMDWNFHSAGIYPRKIENLWGIFSIVFVHANWSHLVNNTFSFLILSSSLYYFYKQLASKVLVISYIFSGLILWIIGRESWHIGASGLIYSLAFFLFFSGLIRKHIPLISISFIVTLLYGNMIWHIFPWQIKDPISWEGHLAGGIIGFILSLFYKNNGPQKPVKQWDDENEEEEEEEEEKNAFWNDDDNITSEKLETEPKNSQNPVRSTSTSGLSD